MIKNLITGITGMILTTLPAFWEALPQYISVITSCLVAISTCLLQIYMAWKNKDVKKEDTTN